MSRTGDTADNQAGYTLTELLVVLAIISIFAAILPASYRAVIPGAQLSYTTSSTVSLLQEARSHSVGTSQDVHVLIDAEAGKISIEGGGRDIDLPNQITATYRPAFSNGDGSDLDRQLSFFADGSSSGGVVLITGRNSSREINVHWLLGNVSVQ